jgi:LysR family transcriptional regulator, low CO2-responsive transcriptional regulator
MKNASLRQLRVFSAVARHSSFVRAAEELGLTPPAVSMQIKELETEVGLPLFDRSSRKVSLTMVGEYVLAYTQRVLRAMRDAEDMVARFRGLRTGMLDVAMVSTAKYFLPRLLARFRDEHPGVEIRLHVGNNREEVVALMREGTVELAIMGRPPKNWPSRAEPFAMHPHVLVTSVEHPFARVERVPVSALLGEELIAREPGSGTRAALEEFMEAHQMTPRIVMQMSSNEAIKQAVMAGMGISLLSLHTIGLELDHGLIAAPETEGLPVMRRWHVVHTQAKTLSPPAEAFRYFMLENAEAYLAAHFTHGNSMSGESAPVRSGARAPTALAAAADSIGRRE